MKDEKYKCTECSYTTNRKKDYDGHMNRQTPCVKEPFECKKCGKVFTQKVSLEYHVDHNVCEKKNIKIKSKKEKNVIVGNNNKIKRDTYNKINCDTYNIDNSVHIEGDVIINLDPLTPFGMEELEILSAKLYKTMLSWGCDALTKLFKHIHFNKKLPQFQNIYKTNIRDKRVIINNYKGQWENDDLKEIISNIINDLYVLIKKKYKEFKNDLSESSIRNIETFLKAENDKVYKKRLTNDLIKIMYDNRAMVIESRKKREEYNKLHNIKENADTDDLSDEEYYNKNIKNNEIYHDKLERKMEKFMLGIKNEKQKLEINNDELIKEIRIFINLLTDITKINYYDKLIKCLEKNKIIDLSVMEDINSNNIIKDSINTDSEVMHPRDDPRLPSTHPVDYYQLQTTDNPNDKLLEEINKSKLGENLKIKYINKIKNINVKDESIVNNTFIEEIKKSCLDIKIKIKYIARIEFNPYKLMPMALF